MLHVHDSQAGHRLVGNAFDRDDGSAQRAVVLRHAPDRGRVAPDHVVGQQHAKWLAAHGLSRHEHGVAQAELFVLRYAAHVRHPRYVQHPAQQGAVSAAFQRRLEIRLAPEVVGHGLLARRDYQHDVFDAGPRGLLYGQVQGRAVEHGYEHLGYRAGGRQKARAEARHGNYGLANGQLDLLRVRDYVAALSRAFQGCGPPRRAP